MKNELEQELDEKDRYMHEKMEEHAMNEKYAQKRI